MEVQGGEKYPSTRFLPWAARPSAAFRSARRHIGGNNTASGTLTPHWQMCAVFGQSFTQLLVSARARADETDNAMPLVALALIQGAVSDGDTASVSCEEARPLLLWPYLGTRVVLKGCECVRVCERVGGWAVVAVPPLTVEPLSGLGRDGWPEEDPEIQVSACFSSVQSSEKE